MDAQEVGKEEGGEVSSAAQNDGMGIGPAGTMTTTTISSPAVVESVTHKQSPPRLASAER